MIDRIYSKEEHGRRRTALRRFYGITAMVAIAITVAVSAITWRLYSVDAALIWGATSCVATWFIAAITLFHKFEKMAGIDGAYYVIGKGGQKILYDRGWPLCEEKPEDLRTKPQAQPHPAAESYAFRDKGKDPTKSTTYMADLKKP